MSHASGRRRPDGLWSKACTTNGLARADENLPLVATSLHNELPNRNKLRNGRTALADVAPIVSTDSKDSSMRRDLSAELIGASRQIQELIQEIGRVARSD